MGWLRFAVIAAPLAFCSVAWTQAPDYGVGRTPTTEEIRAWDISISPEGRELPPGQGSAKEGATLYIRKGCAACHGAKGSSGGHAPTLIVGTHIPASVPCLSPCVNDSNAMAIHSPYATAIWDYINRAMPIGKEGSLAPNEVYALTAFLLYKNGVIKEDDVLDQKSLPKVKMPNSDGMALPPEWKHGQPRLQGYP